MSSPLNRVVLFLAGLLGLTAVAAGFPKPSPYPISWELKFEHSKPKRIVVTPTGSTKPQAYWYMTYTVTNLGDQKQKFLPVFELMVEEGKVTRSDNNIPSTVLETIRVREKASKLEAVTEIGGIVLIGEDQARDGVAIWPEPKAEMGQFTIFVAGLSGEAVIVKEEKDPKKEPTVLRKTLGIDCHVPGDEKYPSLDVVEAAGEQWIMR
jgi:hypothetical protein